MTLSPQQLAELALYDSWQAMQAQLMYGQQTQMNEQLAKQLASVAGAKQQAGEVKPAPAPRDVLATNDGNQLEGSTPE